MAQIHNQRETTPSLFDEPEAQKATPEKPKVSPARAARLRRIARNGNKIVVLLEALYKDLLAETPERFRGMDRASVRMGDAREDYSKAHERASFFAKSNAEYAERQLKAAGEPLALERQPRQREEPPNLSESVVLPTLSEIFKPSHDEDDPVTEAITRL